MSLKYDNNMLSQLPYYRLILSLSITFKIYLLFKQQKQDSKLHLLIN